jgi:hypothetical protein
MPFNSQGIIKKIITQPNLETFLVGFDLGAFRYEALSEVLMDTIVDFAFGYHTGILKTYDRRILKEAAKSIYNIKAFSEVKWTYVDNNSELLDCELKAENKYLKRGEFGELILHLLLRDFYSTVPLLSKIYFKDTDGAVVHGFDTVHIGPDIEDSAKTSLFLGESKVYSRKDNTAGINGIKDLVDDIKHHFKKDFLYREIALIGKKRYSYKPIDNLADTSSDVYQQFLKDKDSWFDLMSKVESHECKLEDFLHTVTVPLVCTYQSAVLSKFDNETDEDFIKEYNAEMEALKTVFEAEMAKIIDEKGEPVRTKLKVILILFPLPNKKELVKLLHQKLYNQQNA